MATKTVTVRELRTGDQIVHVNSLYRVFALGRFPRQMVRVRAEGVTHADLSFDRVLNENETIVVNIP